MHPGRLTGALAAATGLLVAVLASAPPLTYAPAQAQGTCPDPARALGVARTVEIDTTAGPRFGAVQYANSDLLRDGEVVLTFDDGPMRAYTRAVLEALDAHCTRATFFMVGRMALSDPAMVQMVASRGHTIGAHTWSHKNLAQLSPAKARDEIELGFSAIQQALGRPIAPFFRFPYLSAPRSAVDHVQARQSGIFSIDVDSVDFRTRDPKVMSRTVLNALASRRKGILLFHDIQRSTALGLHGLLDELKARGFKVVHLVPKAPLVTLAEYDQRVSGEARRRQRIVDKNPLAQRALGWSVWDTKVATPKPGIIGTVAAPTATPGGAPPPPAAAAAPPPAASPRPPRAEEDWRSGIFNSH